MSDALSACVCRRSRHRRGALDGCYPCGVRDHPHSRPVSRSAPASHASRSRLNDWSSEQCARAECFPSPSALAASAPVPVYAGASTFEYGRNRLPRTRCTQSLACPSTRRQRGKGPRTRTLRTREHWSSANTHESPETSLGLLDGGAWFGVERRRHTGRGPISTASSGASLGARSGQTRRAKHVAAVSRVCAGDDCSHRQSRSNALIVSWRESWSHTSPGRFAACRRCVYTGDDCCGPSTPNTATPLLVYLSPFPHHLSHHR